MPKLDSFLEKVVYPLMVLVLTPCAIAIGSFFTTGNIMDWLIQVPKWGWSLRARSELDSPNSILPDSVLLVESDRTMILLVIVVLLVSNGTFVHPSLF